MLSDTDSNPSRADTGKLAESPVPERSVFGGLIGAIRRKFIGVSATPAPQPPAEQPPSAEPVPTAPYHFKEFLDAEFSFENLMEELIPAIRKHPYAMIIGDDAGGRLPTLVIHEVMDELCRRHGIPRPAVRFYAGGRRGNSTALEEEAYRKIGEDLQRKVKDLKGGRILLTTEYMSGGLSMDYMASVLKSLGVDFDIAALSLAHMRYDPYGRGDSEGHDIVPNLRGVHIYGGLFGVEEAHPLFHDVSAISGVRKDPTTSDIFAHLTHSNPEDVRKAREDCKTLARKLVDQFDWKE